MKNKLFFEVDNFLPINHAKIEIGKINIVAGVNASGKSTFSKLLYSAIASNCNEGLDVYKELLKNVLSNFQRELIRFVEVDEKLQPFYDYLKELDDEYVTAEKILNYGLETKLKEIENVINESDEINSNRLLQSFLELKYVLSLFENNNKRINQSLAQILYKEFGQERKILFKWNEGYFKLYSEENSVMVNVDFPLKKIDFLSQDVDNIHDEITIKGSPPINDVFYVETPYILDFAPKYKYSNEKFMKYSGLSLGANFVFHQKALLNKLYSNEANYGINDDFNDNLLKLFDSILQGFINYDDDKGIFKFKQDVNEFQMENTASGIKTIGILKTLVANGLDNDSLIIMDEPEVHLHPEWQIELARIIVLLSVEGNINFHINSHSPQFIEAIDTYSMLYGINNDINYYLAEKKGNSFDINPIKRENISEIYNQLGDPYDKLDQVRAEIRVRKALSD